MAVPLFMHVAPGASVRFSCNFTDLAGNLDTLTSPSTAYFSVYAMGASAHYGALTAQFFTAAADSDGGNVYDYEANFTAPNAPGIYKVRMTAGNVTNGTPQGIAGLVVAILYVVANVSDSQTAYVITGGSFAGVYTFITTYNNLPCWACYNGAAWLYIWWNGTQWVASSVKGTAGSVNLTYTPQNFELPTVQNQFGTTPGWTATGAGAGPVTYCGFVGVAATDTSGNALATAANLALVPTQQQIAKERYACAGVVWHIVYNASESMTYSAGVTDGQSWGTAFKTAGAGIANLINGNIISAVPAANDLVLIGPGTFALETLVPAPPTGVSVKGAGIDLTILTSAFVAENNSNWCVASNAYAEDFTLRLIGSSSTYQYGMGSYSHGNTLVNFALRRIKIVGFSDCFFFEGSSSSFSGVIDDCRAYAAYDTFNINGYLAVSADILIRRCLFVATGPFAGTPTGFTRSLAISAGNSAFALTVEDSTLVALNAGGDTSAIENQSGVITASRCSLYAADSTGEPAYSVNCLGTGIAKMIGCAYDETLTQGTVVDVAGTDSASGASRALDESGLKAIDNVAVVAGYPNLVVAVTTPGNGVLTGAVEGTYIPLGLIADHPYWYCADPGPGASPTWIFWNVGYNDYVLSDTFPAIDTQFYAVSADNGATFRAYYTNGNPGNAYCGATPSIPSITPTAPTATTFSGYLPNGSGIAVWTSGAANTGTFGFKVASNVVTVTTGALAVAPTQGDDFAVVNFATQIQAARIQEATVLAAGHVTSATTSVTTFGVGIDIGTLPTGATTFAIVLDGQQATGTYASGTVTLDVPGLTAPPSVGDPWVVPVSAGGGGGGGGGFTGSVSYPLTFQTASGQVLSGVTVTIYDSTNTTRVPGTAYSDNLGVAIVNLDPGNYVARATLVGFSSIPNTAFTVVLP